MSRCIRIPMVRHDGTRPLRRFDKADTADLDAVYSHIRQWATSAMINHDPVMPAEVRGRLADNWRSLIAVADACSPAWGALTREPAVAFSKSCHDEDIRVVLLQRILEVFDAWKASPRFLTMLADAERDVQDELEDFP